MNKKIKTAIKIASIGIVCALIGLIIGISIGEELNLGEKNILRGRIWNVDQWRNIGLWCKPILDESESYLCEEFHDEYVDRCELIEKCE